MLKSRRIFNAVLLLMVSALPAMAELRSYTCTFPPSQRALIPATIALTYDAASRGTMIEDKVILKYAGNPVKADVMEIRNIRTVYDWRVVGIPYTIARFGFVDYRLKIERNGRAVVTTSPQFYYTGAVAKGRCT